MKRAWQHWKGFPPDRKVEIVILTVGVFVAITVMLTTCGQLGQMQEQTKAMREQLAEMKAGSEDTKSMIKSAKIQSDSTAKLADSAIAQVEQLKAGVQESHRLASITQDTLNANMDAFRLDTRPWLGHGDIVLSPEFNGSAMNMIKAGNLPVFGTKIHNFGRSPAMNVEVRTGSIILKSSEKFSPQYSKRPPTSSRSAIWPGAIATTGQSSPFSRPVEEEQVALIKRGELIVYYYGELSYEDIFGKRHLTSFCMYLSARHGGMTDCHTYNEAT